MSEQVVTRQRVVWIVVAIVLGRWSYTQVSGVGGMQSLTSPSMFYTAHAAQWSGIDFFGGARHRQDLWVTDPSGRTVWATSLEGSPLDFGGPAGVEWTPDSSEVWFRGQDANGSRVELRGPTLAAVTSVEAMLQGATP